MSLLSTTQAKILHAIRVLEGYPSAAKVAEYLGELQSVVDSHMKMLSENGYIDIREGQVNGVGWCISRSCLTAKGEVAVDAPDKLIQDQPRSTFDINLSVGSMYAPLSLNVVSGENNSIDISQSSVITNEISKILDQIDILRNSVDNIPEPAKEEAQYNLDKLKEELQKPNRQPIEIRTRFNSFLRLVLPFVPMIVGGIVDIADFANNLTDLSQKFDITILPEQVEVLRQALEASEN